MEIFLGLLLGLYIAVSLMLVIVGGLVLCLDGQYYEMECVLTNKRDFIGCIFGFQMFVWDIAKEYNINIFGVILMEIFMTAFAIYYNILAFVVLMIAFAVKYFCKAFVFIFRKNPTNSPTPAVKSRGFFMPVNNIFRLFTVIYKVIYPIFTNFIVQYIQRITLYNM